LTVGTKHFIGIDLAVIAAPAALVLGARVMFSPAPAVSAAGAEATAPVVIPAAATKKVRPEQERAAEWIRAMGNLEGIRSPMAHPIPKPVVVIVQPEPDKHETVPTPEAPKASPIAGLKLTGVLGSSEGNLAVLNGKVYKIGMAVRPGVTLTAIDARTNTITFTLADGTELKLARQVDPLSK